MRQLKNLGLYEYVSSFFLLTHICFPKPHCLFLAKEVEQPSKLFPDQTETVAGLGCRASSLDGVLVQTFHSDVYAEWFPKLPFNFEDPPHLPGKTSPFASKPAQQSKRSSPPPPGTTHPAYSPPASPLPSNLVSSRPPSSPHLQKGPFCSINTPSDRGVCSVRVRDPVEREKKKETRSNALGRTRAGSSGRAGRVANALVYAIERIDASTPRRGTG